VNPFTVALADLRRSRAGAIAIVVLIGLAVALGVAISAQERALRDGSARAADAFDLIIGAPGSEIQLVLSTVYLQPGSVGLVRGSILQDLTKSGRVTYAAPIGFGDSYRTYPLVGTTAEFVQQGTGGVSEGRVFGNMFEVVIGADVQLSLGDTFHPGHGQVGAAAEEEEHEEVEFSVVGRLRRQGNPWDRAILSPIEATWWTHGLPIGRDLEHLSAQPHPDLRTLPIGPPWDAARIPGVPAIVAKPRTVSDAYALRAQYRSGETMALFPAEILVKLYDLLGNVRDLLAVISVITQVLVIGAVLLAVLATLSQRKRLIGVLRALGASRGYIFAMVWINVSLMIAAGACLGLLLGWAGAVLLSMFFEQRSGLTLPVTIASQELQLIGILIAVGALLAAVPSALVYREPVSRALRS
jgi:putative ABC transport system permease protein